jgi:hypothetical protein
LAATFKVSGRVRQTRLDILAGQVRERLEKIAQVWVIGEVLNDPFDRNAGFLARVEWSQAMANRHGRADE